MDQWITSMAKISVDSLLGNLQSQSSKTSGILKQIDLKTDNNIRKASMLNVSLDAEEEEEELSAEKPKDIFDFKIPKESMKSEPAQQKFGNIMGQQDYANLMDSSSGGGSVAAGGGQQTGGDLGAAVLGAGGLALGTMGTDAINNIFGTPSGEGQQPGGDSIDYVAPGKVSPVVTGKYGEPRKSGPHGGTDLGGMPEGTPLRAISDGKIIDTGIDPKGWGNFVVFVDDKGIHHLYGHVQNGYRGKGDIKKGDIIARVGMTGSTTGPHLHWETGTRWTGRVLTGKFDPLNRYSMHAPFSTAKAPSASTQAKPAPSAPTTPTALQPAPRQPATTVPSGAQPSGTQSSQRVSSSPTPTYRGSAERSSATYQQGLS